jgi:hypothetical protein
MSIWFGKGKTNDAAHAESKSMQEVKKLKEEFVETRLLEFVPRRRYRQGGIELQL